jgi:hypothetical protein
MSRYVLSSLVLSIVTISAFGGRVFAITAIATLGSRIPILRRGIATLGSGITILGGRITPLWSRIATLGGRVFAVGSITTLWRRVFAVVAVATFFRVRNRNGLSFRFGKWSWSCNCFSLRVGIGCWGRKHCGEDRKNRKQVKSHYEFIRVVD